MHLTTFAAQGALHAVLEHDVDPEWTVVYHLALQGGHVVVAALALHPRNTNRLLRDAGVWEDAGKGLAARAPHGGLPARLLRKIRVGEHVHWGREVFRQVRPWRRMTKELRQAMTLFLRSELGRPFAAPVRPTQPPGPGRPPISTDSLLRVAVLYAEAVARKKSRQPVVEVAKLLGESTERISHLVYLARRHDLLTRGHPGRAGGDLTDKARALLKKRKRHHAESRPPHRTPTPRLTKGRR